MAASRKLYIDLAKTIRYYVDAADRDTANIYHRLIVDLCHDFKADNTNFDQARFMTACGFA
jgi:hypothetical protein